MKNIILASTSPRRKELFERLRIPFKTVDSNYEEDMDLDISPMELAKFLSRGKAKAVVSSYPNSIIVGADTFIALDQELLGKPGTEERAKEMLGKISGKVILVISGMTVIDTAIDKVLSRAHETKVHIKELTSEEIFNYIKTREPLDKGGAFAIQGLGAVLVERIEGDYNSVMGLPLFMLSEMLKEFGINIL